MCNCAKKNTQTERRFKKNDLNKNNNILFISTY